MKDIYLLNYSVKGIKTLDNLISLSFYKKGISRNPDTQEYNIKGIYGMNGSGKSGIVTSVEILKNILIHAEYLNNPIVQNNLEAMINKKTEELFVEVDFLAKTGEAMYYYRYSVTLGKDKNGKYVIVSEKLAVKKATSRSEAMETIFEVVNGEGIYVYEKNGPEFAGLIIKKTTNLLSSAAMSALFFEKIFGMENVRPEIYRGELFRGLAALAIFGKKLHVFMDESDDHRKYFLRNSISSFEELYDDRDNTDTLMNYFLNMEGELNNVLSVSENVVPKQIYGQFEKNVENLCAFLRIFKSDLQKIEIDKKEDQDAFICNLVMVYEGYRIYAEFESTGIKKLIRLFAYLREMVQGGIVFIDEFDSNLHDVYLCALLEYLMEYGQGQLCFTTHNVGPMDILKQNKKSIEFLSVDHRIYPWTANGNYSPSRLYRNGMIEGSPFNVDSIDFIGAFGTSEGEF